MPLFEFQSAILDPPLLTSYFSVQIYNHRPRKSLSTKFHLNQISFCILAQRSRFSVDRASEPLEVLEPLSVSQNSSNSSDSSDSSISSDSLNSSESSNSSDRSNSSDNSHKFEHVGTLRVGFDQVRSRPFTSLVLGTFHDQKQKIWKCYTCEEY